MSSSVEDMSSANSAANTEDDELAYIKHLKVGEAMRLCRDTTYIDVIIELTKHPDPKVRQRAVKEICPCHVQKDIDAFWERVLEMRHDEAANVRQQVLHDLCDGSPAHLEFDVAEALQDFNIDPDPEIRRKAHKALTSYRRKGKWNVL